MFTYCTKTSNLVCNNTLLIKIWNIWFFGNCGISTLDYDSYLHFGFPPLISINTHYKSNIHQVLQICNIVETHNSQTGRNCKLHFIDEKTDGWILTQDYTANIWQS